MDEMPFGKRLYAGWMAIVGRFGHAQTLVILAVFYAVMIGPVALGAGIVRADLLGKRGLRSGGSAWEPADSAKPDLERAKLTS